MKALGILGTGSSAGKSWVTTAYCAWLKAQGLRVAPFKAQNMSNNAWVTLEGGEMARAQAIQAEACGLRPIAEMNPILLKPSGGKGSQTVLLGRAGEHCPARDYYKRMDQFWATVCSALEYWKNHCDVLVMEGAGSPVELNLMDKDLSNLRPVHQVDGKWLLVSDVDRGGGFAKLSGTWMLLGEKDRRACLGALFNRFKGDLSLFQEPDRFLAPHAPGLKLLGTLPFAPDLQPEEEDGLAPGDEDRGQGDLVVWIRLPHAANLSDCQPWWDDSGVRTRWTSDPSLLGSARVIVIPGTKNTMADLRWLRETGFEKAIQAAAGKGVLILGICGGFQILGEELWDPEGVAGDEGTEKGLCLLPSKTRFEAPKIVREVQASFGGQEWMAYEIHMGRTEHTGDCKVLQEVKNSQGTARAEGLRKGRVMGTYLHGWFESPKLRAWIMAQAGCTEHRAFPLPWKEKRQAIYGRMAQLLETHANMEPIKRHLEI